MGLSCRGVVTHWTAEQDQLIKEKFPKEGVKPIKQVYPQYSDMAIIRRAKKLGINYEFIDWENVKPHPKLLPSMQEVWANVLRDTRHGMLQKEIAKRYGLGSAGRVGAFLYGKSPLTNWTLRQSLPKELTPEQQEVIEGTLLGDASLHYLLNERRETYYTHAQKKGKQEYVEGVCKILKPFSKEVKTHKQRRPTRIGGKVSHDQAHWDGTFLESSEFRTLAHPLLTAYRLKWYEDPFRPKSQKIVPRDITLTWRKAAFWAMDDGTTSKKGRQFVLCTNGFRLQDVEFLIQILDRDLGLKASLARSNGKPIIRFNGLQAKKFIEGVTPYFLWESVKYKLAFKPYKRDINRIAGVSKNREGRWVVQSKLLGRQERFFVTPNYGEASFYSIVLHLLTLNLKSQALDWQPSFSLIPLHQMPTPSHRRELVAQVAVKLREKGLLENKTTRSY